MAQVCRHKRRRDRAVYADTDSVGSLGYGYSAGSYADGNSERNAFSDT